MRTSIYILFITLLYACKKDDSLDVSPRDRLSDATVWTDPSTADVFLNDIYGFHVKESHAWEALDSARSGVLREGNVGGGTGMMCLGFKGGTGTSSRVVKIKDSTYTVGVLVQANFGAKRNLTIAGVPVGRELRDTMNYEFKAAPS